MKLISQASIKQGQEIEFTFDTGHVLSVYANGSKWITLGNRSAVIARRPNIYQQMLIAIEQFLSDERESNETTNQNWRGIVHDPRCRTWHFSNLCVRNDYGGILIMGISRHDAYYEPDDYDDRSDEIEERAWQLMKPGAMYDYRTGSAISEALSEMGVDDAKALQDVIDTGDFEMIGRKVTNMAYEYMERFALDSAANEIND